jgi:HK97 family phage major capsid protein
MFITLLRDQIAELTTARDGALDELDAIAATLTTEKRSAKDDEDARIGELRTAATEAQEAIDAKDAELASLEAVQEARNAAPKPPRTSPAFNPNRSANDEDLYAIERSVIRSTQLTPADRPLVRDLQAKALTAIERSSAAHFTADQREAVTQHVQRDAKVAEYVLLTGSQEYEDQFEDFVRSQGRKFGPALERAAMSLTTANGGAMVPYTLDPSVMLTNAGVQNPMRQLARVETIVGSNEWRGVTSAGVTAEWLGEGSQAADASPTFAQPAIPTFKGAAYLFGSYEVLGDSGFAGQVQRLIMDAKDRLEGSAFTTGNGTTAPQGWVTGKVAAGSLVASAAADTFAVGDVYNTQAGLAPRFRTSRAAWQANVAILNRIRQFDTNGGSALWAQLAAGMPPALLGNSAYETSDMDGVINALAENYVLGYADWDAAYVIVDRVGVEVYYDNLVLGANQRPTGQAGFFAFWRVGGEVVVPEAISLLNVT